jgi:hypothetical protein
MSQEEFLNNRYLKIDQITDEIILVKDKNEDNEL